MRLRLLKRQTSAIAKEIQNLKLGNTETVEQDDRIKEHLKEFKEICEDKKYEIVEIEKDDLDNWDYDDNKQALKRFRKLFCQDSRDNKNYNKVTAAVVV